MSVRVRIRFFRDERGKDRRGAELVREAVDRESADAWARRVIENDGRDPDGTGILFLAPGRKAPTGYAAEIVPTNEEGLNG